MTTPAIKSVVDRFNEDRKDKVDITYRGSEFVITAIPDKPASDRPAREIGRIHYASNFSNCGLNDVHNLKCATQTGANLVIEFIKFYAKENLISVLLYNTAHGQTMVKKALEDNGFHTVKKKFNNKSSGHSMTFHILQVR